MGSDTESSQPKIVQASEILAKIESGEPVEYKNAIVEGNLDLGKLDLPTEHVERTEFEIKTLGLTEEVKVIKFPISIMSSELRGDVNFRNTIFRESVDFGGTFSGAQFSSDTNFRGAQFSGDAVFEEAKFGGYADFKVAKFGGVANFLRAQFSDGADFWEAQFSGDANFWEIQFRGGYVDFRKAQFSSDANFWRVQFSGYAIFGEAQFSCDAIFGEAQFSSDANFVEAQFSGDAYFSEAQFSDNRNAVTNFGNALFGGSTSFEDTQFSPYTDLRAAQFNSSLYLTHARFDRLEIGWGSIHHLNCNETVYIALIRNFRDLAQFDDADNCLYQYRRWKQKNRNFGWLKTVDVIACLTCGYGARLSHTLACIFGSILVFALLYSIFGGIADSSTLDISRDVVVSNNNTSQFISTYEGTTEPLPFFKCLYFSVMVLTGRVPEYLHPIGNWEYVVMIESILGYLFLALFVVVLTRKLIR